MLLLVLLDNAVKPTGGFPVPGAKYAHLLKMDKAS